MMSAVKGRNSMSVHRSLEGKMKSQKLCSFEKNGGNMWSGTSTPVTEKMPRLIFFFTVCTINKLRFQCLMAPFCIYKLYMRGSA